METSVNIDFGNGFSVRQSISPTISGQRIRSSGTFHRLSPEQFDALADSFSIGDEIRTLTTDSGRTFRTASIDFGGMALTIFSDVPSTVDADQLSLL